MKIRPAGGALPHGDGRDKVTSLLSQVCERAQKDGDIFLFTLFL